jgi:hypothetical protein
MNAPACELTQAPILTAGEACKGDDTSAPWRWAWGESADGIGWHAVPTVEVDPSQKWRQYIQARSLTPTEILVARSHMCGFMRAVDPGYKSAWATDLVCDRITRLSRRARGITGPGTLACLILRAPPQHFKTYLCEEHAPPFIAAQDPTARIINLCYSRNLSARNIRVCGNIMDRGVYKQLSRVRAGRMKDADGVSHEDEAKASMLRFMIDGGRSGVARGPGYYISVGMQSELTGWAGEVGICGDAVKTPDEAFSPMHREKTLARVQSMFFTRRQQNSVILLGMSPWHPEDVSYAVQELAISAGLDCEVMELPARATSDACALHPEDPRIRGSGDILDPVRHDEAFYRAQEVLVGRFWKPLYLLTPANYGPVLVPSGAWTEYDPHWLAPSSSGGRPAAVVQRVYVSIDTNGDKGGASNAHISVFFLVSYLGRNMLWKIGQQAGPWSWSEMRERVLAVVERVGRRVQCPWDIIIERKALGPALINELELSRGRLIALGVAAWTLHSEYPTQSKRLRADECVPYIEGGVVCIPDRAIIGLPNVLMAGPLGLLTDIKWVDGSIGPAAGHKQAWSSHPNPLPGAHDLVDADSQCIRKVVSEGRIQLGLVLGSS